MTPKTSFLYSEAVATVLLKLLKEINQILIFFSSNQRAWMDGDYS